MTNSRYARLVIENIVVLAHSVFLLIITATFFNLPYDRFTSVLDLRKI